MNATAIAAPTQVISVASAQIAAAAQTSAPRVEPITQAKKSADPLVQSIARFSSKIRCTNFCTGQAHNLVHRQPKTTPAAPATTHAQAAPQSAHVVRSNESLWGIASRIAAEENLPCR